MLGSPNFIRYVYRGASVQPLAQNASIRLEKALSEYLTSERLPFELNNQNGGSDFLPFLEAGIPTSGVLTGAGEIKTVAQRATYGGFANAPTDPCYHLSCDTTANINTAVLQQMARSTAHALYQLSSKTNLKDWLRTGQ